MASLPDLSPPSSLHRGLALECSFTFVTLADLSRVVRVSREWRSLFSCSADSLELTARSSM